MKSQNKKIKLKKEAKINNKKMKEIGELKAIDENGYPIPLSKICLEHGEKFWLTFSFATKNYCLKNSLFYWTSKEENKDEFICSPCLRNKLSDSNKRKEFLKFVENSKKGHLRSYLSRNII